MILPAIVAYFWPEPFKVAPIVLNVFFGLTMFGIGVVLNVDDFKRIGKRPVIVLIGSAAQFTIMPLGAYVLGRLFNLPPTLAAGLILAGCAPGAMASNVMCYVGGGGICASRVPGDSSRSYNMAVHLPIARCADRLFFFCAIAFHTAKSYNTILLEISVSRQKYSIVS